MYTKEDINKAVNVDIVDYCKQNNIDLVSDNERYFRLEEHDSLVIDRRKNAYFWNSNGTGGNILNFIQEVEKVNFKEAMTKVLEEGKYAEKEEIEYVQEPYEYDPTKELTHFEKAREYLINTRGIDPEIVDNLHQKGLLKQDKRNNVLFLWKDYERVMGCSEQGTYHTDRFKRGSWKSVQKNSTADYGFNVKYGDPKNLKFFESSIDLLSYASINKRDLEDTHLISMEGLKHNTVFNYIIKAKQETNESPDSISLCVDNDKAGQNFVEKLSNFQLIKSDGTRKDIQAELPSSKDGVKDWNDLLKKKRESKEVQRRELQKRKMMYER